MNIQEIKQVILHRPNWFPNLVTGVVVGIKLPIESLTVAVLLGISNLGQAMGMALLQQFFDNVIFNFFFPVR